MRSKSQTFVSHVLVISFVLVASLFVFIGRAAAQEIGTVKNADGSTTTTVRDTTYGTYGVKSTTTDSTGRVTEEELMGNKDKRGHRPILKEINTSYGKGGVTVVETATYNLKESGETDLVTSKLVKTDALGGVITDETMKYGEHFNITEGTRTTVDPTSGEKTTQKYNPKTEHWETVEPEKKEEPKKEPPKEPEKKINPTSFELFGGFAYMRAPDETAKNLFGFNASLFYNVTPHVGIGGDFTGVFGSTTETVGTIPFNISLHRFTYMAGPQFIAGKHYGVKYSVHALFGGVHDTTKTTIGTTSVSSSASAFAMAFGGGVDVNLNNHFAVRPIQFDYVPTHFGGAWQSNYRISTGLVIRFGGKK